MKLTERLNLSFIIENYKKREVIGVFLFTIVYFVWFFVLESLVKPKYYIYCRLDDMVPFCEYFIIPYFAWFLFIPCILIYFFFYSPADFRYTAAFAATGMIICLTIYTFFPNAQQLRPDILPRNNILSSLVELLYGFDTSTNVCPSLHTFNTLAVEIGIFRSPALKENLFIKISSSVLSALIIAATVLLKQHSVIDVFCAILLAAVLFIFIKYFNFNFEAAAPVSEEVI